MIISKCTTSIVNNNLFKRAWRLLEILVGSGLFGNRPDDTIAVNKFLAIVSRRKETRGGIDTIKWLKATRLNLYTYLAGNPVIGNFMSTDSDGLSRAFTCLRPHIKSGDKGAIRLAMTMLQLSRLINSWNEPKMETITDEPSYDEKSLIDFNTYVSIKSPNFIRNLNPRWSSPHLTNKAGPSGRAILVSKEELFLLSNDLKEAIMDLGGFRLRSYMHELHRLWPSDLYMTSTKETRKGQIRRLSIIKDTEAKSRVIAIGDYWSQTSLKPLHKVLLKALRGWKECDVTIGQSIAPFGREDQSYYSFDLTAATDRIPVACYREIINHAYGRDVFESWKTLKIRTPFWYESKEFKYSTGQPMGLYSSWVLLAHFHHLVIRYSAALVKISNFRDYRVLGDDVVIRNDLVAAQYLKVMTSLGIGISKEKTLVSKDSFEFAKRFFYKGDEVTGFPLSALISTDWLDMCTTLLEAIRRGYSANILKDRSLITSVFTRLFNEDDERSRNFYQRLSRKVLTQLILRQGLLRSGEPKFEELGLLWSKPVSCNNIQSFKDCLIRAFYKDVTDDIDAHVAKQIDLSYEVNRELVIPVTKGSTVQGIPEYQLPLVRALNESVELLLLDMTELSEVLIKASNEGINAVHSLLTWYESKDLRSYDPSVLDPARRSERAFRKSSTLLVRTMSQL